MSADWSTHPLQGQGPDQAARQLAARRWVFGRRHSMLREELEPQGELLPGALYWTFCLCLTFWLRTTNPRTKTPIRPMNRQHIVNRIIVRASGGPVRPGVGVAWPSNEEVGTG